MNKTPLMKSLEVRAPRVSVIVPAYREAANLPLLMAAISAALSPPPGKDMAPVSAWEVVVVDDDSPDGSDRGLEELSKTYPQLRYVIRKNERGLSSAVLEGIARAGYELIVVMDADLSHPAEAIPSLLRPLVEGSADFVIGSRYVKGGATEDWTWLRYLNSQGATLLAKPLMGSIRDPMAGFFAMRRADLERTDALNPIGYKIGVELIVKSGVETRVSEVPIVFRNRIHGESKMTMKEQYRYLEHLSRLYDYRYPKASPRLKFLVAVGCGMAACALVADMGSIFGMTFAYVVGLLAMIAVTAAFFTRYMKSQGEVPGSTRRYVEFGVISSAEFAGGLSTALLVSQGWWMSLMMGVAVMVVIRYTLRKVFLHDLRGVRGSVNDRGARRLALGTAHPVVEASALAG